MQSIGGPEKRRRMRACAVYAACVLLLFAAIVSGVNAGSVPIPASRILRILTGAETGTTEADIIMKIRMPRILLAGILGGGLAVSGFLLQTFFANPIAGPYILGISSGAKLSVALLMIGVMGGAGRLSSLSMVGAALLGAMLVTGVILLLARHLGQMASLLVAGIMVGYICSAITDFLITFADDSNIVNLHGWSQGSFSGADWGSVILAAAVIFPSAAAAFLLSKPMNAFQLGEGYARSMGVNVRTFRMALVLLSGILSACVAALAGPISFVGIAAPFLARQSLRTAKPILVIPGCFLEGAVFCMFCDQIARTAFAPTELNISTVTAFFGAPAVIWMMLQRRREHA
ncbi:MAG: iron ABC transporter permease [Clostridium sp.]|nr:iron ABC transporter permease [Clostridium sp.]